MSHPNRDTPASRRATPRATLAMRAAVGLVAVGAAASSVSGVFDRTWTDPEPALSVSKSSVADTVIRTQRDAGIIFTDRQDNALRRLIGLWERRNDVQTLFSTPGGQPDMVNLLRWAEQDNDPDALQLAVIRPALREAAARMGIMRADGSVIEVFVQSVAMRPKPRFVAGGSLWDLAQVWGRRPDLQQRFSSNGVVDVRALFTWAASVPTNDPDAAVLAPVAGTFDQLVEELPPRKVK
jgi:hypothetical protein